MAKRIRRTGYADSSVFEQGAPSSPSSGSLTMESLDPLVGGLELRYRELLSTASRDFRALIARDNLLQFGASSINPPALRIFNLKPGDRKRHKFS